MKTKQIVHGSTFSGIGAPEVAAEMLGWHNAFHCEINPFGRAVLDYYFPKAESYEDITKQDFSKWRGKITVLTGGFPCQPFSYAGKRRGSEDDRYLWPYMLKCIQEVRPTWFVGENVAGITTMVFPGEDVKVGESATLFDTFDRMERRERYVIEEICQQLEDIGYAVQPMLIPACAVGAPHRRDRVFFIAHRDIADTEYQRPIQCEQQERTRFGEGIFETRGDRLCDAERPTPDPSCSGSGTQEASGRTESDRSDRLSQQSQWRDQTQRTDGLSPLQGYAPDPECDRGREVHQPLQSQLTDGAEPISNGRQSDVADTRDTRLQVERSQQQATRTTRNDEGQSRLVSTDTTSNGCTSPIIGSGRTRQTLDEGSKDESLARLGRYMLPEERWRTFPTVSPVYRGNDGLPFDVDNLTIPFSQWKKESLKAYGNAIVVQVMYRIFEAIDKIENSANSVNSCYKAL